MIKQIVLEGTDAVGKTTVIEALKEYNIKDRDRNISKLMDFNISLINRANKLNEYLKTINDCIIFLVNNDKDELERRINLRSIIDEYDKYTYLYNLLYLETYTYMEQNDLLQDKLYLVDCTNLSKDEQVKKVRELIKKIN
jgi:broad-specificity NMP kinase